VTALEDRITAAGGSSCSASRSVGSSAPTAASRWSHAPATSRRTRWSWRRRCRTTSRLRPPPREGELRRLQGLQATSAICTVLEMSRSLTPFYWLNIADPEMPFGGLIEHTNYIPANATAAATSLHFQLPVPDHPLYRATKDDVLRSYLPALRRVNPAFDRSWILASHHVRADYAQPVVTVGYREQIPAVRSSVPGLYLCCMAQIFPEDRGMNYAIAYGDRVARWSWRTWAVSARRGCLRADLSSIRARKRKRARKRAGTYHLSRITYHPFGCGHGDVHGPHFLAPDLCSTMCGPGASGRQAEARKMAGKALEVTDGNFHDVIMNAEVPALVTSGRCGAGRAASSPRSSRSSPRSMPAAR